MRASHGANFPNRSNWASEPLVGLNLSSSRGLKVAPMTSPHRLRINADGRVEQCRTQMHRRRAIFTIFSDRSQTPEQMPAIGNLTRHIRKRLHTKMTSHPFESLDQSAMRLFETLMLSSNPLPGQSAEPIVLCGLL